MQKRRFKVTGTRPLGMGDDEYTADEYVDAPDADDATRRATRTLLAVTGVREVPWGEARPWWWRLWRWLRG